jgi:hypothetical protein
MNNHNIEREIKLNKLRNEIKHGERLQIINCKAYLLKEELPVTDRQNLREFLAGTLEITDPHTIQGWIDFLLSLGWFSHNPTSQLSSEKKLKRPTNDTRYFIHFDKIYTPTHITDYSQTSQISLSGQVPTPKPTPINFT